MKPLKRIEHFLAKIAGDSSAKELSPKTRDEYYLNEIAENGGGGSEPFVVTFSGTTDNASCDKTHPEIYEAWKSGRQIVVNYDRGDGDLVTHNLPYRCTVAYEGSDKGFIFSADLFDMIYSNTLSHFILSSGFNDRSNVYQVTINRDDYSLTPQV